MARNLTIIDDKLGISANVKYEALNESEKDKTKVVFKAPNGSQVGLKTVGLDRKPIGQTFKAYLDDTGQEYTPDQLTAVDGTTGEELVKFDATTIFEILKYEPVSNYTDRYIVDKYYEIFPSDDGKKKDIDRKVAQDTNRVAMKKLYDHLIDNNVVAKAEFIVTAGYRASAGYIRPITFDGGKWTLEIGVFKEEKIFDHLNEPHVKVDMSAATASKKKPANKLI